MKELPFDPLVCKEFDYRGHHCIVILHDLGHFCGYFSVPKDHPALHNPDDIMSIHGGFTFGGGKLFWREKRGDKQTYLGFDCAHAGDFLPQMASMMILTGKYKNIDEYKRKFGDQDAHEWTVEEVAEQLRNAIDQLHIGKKLVRLLTKT